MGVCTSIRPTEDHTMACSAHEPLAAEEPELGSYNVPKIGTDSDGDSHYYDAENHRILLVRNREVVDTKDLEGHELGGWVDAVARKVGWETLGLLDELAKAYRGEE